MSKPAPIHAVSSVHSLGCSFLDWSILWLSGQTKIYCYDQVKWVDICTNPLSTQNPNAHNHLRNHKSGWLDNQLLISHLKQVHGSRISIYPSSLHIDRCCQHLNLSVEALKNPESLAQAWSYQKKDYASMLEWLVRDQGLPLIYVQFNSDLRGYRWQHRSIDRLWSQQRPAAGEMELIQEQQDIFFSKSQKHWQTLGLSNIWDTRERMALDIRPFDYHWGDDFVPEIVYHAVSCHNLWFDTENVLSEIQSWLGLPLNIQRLRTWRPISTQWQKVQQDTLRFATMLPELVNAIVYGHEYPVPDLSLFQEAIIQHCLIYQFNLNLRTWQLSKFPNNAKKLHSLLEPNTHPLT